MPDEKWPGWDKLSNEVKRVIYHATTIANNANRTTANAAHIMQALTHLFPNEVLNIVDKVSLNEINRKLKDQLLADPNLYPYNLILDDAYFLAEHGVVKLDQLITSTAGTCGFRIKKTEQKTSTDTPDLEDLELPIEPEFETEMKPSAQVSDFLKKFGRDLTELASSGKLHPIIGRDREINLVIETLCRVFKRNPLLIGPAGVGKTAIVEGLTQKIISNQVPNALQGKRIFELNTASMLGGTKYRGEFEERVTQILQEIKTSDLILFIDEFHSIIGAGQTEGSTLDVPTILLPALARGEISCIGATTDTYYHKYITKNSALERRFQPIRIPELPASETLNMLKQLVPIKFEKPQNLQIDANVYSQVIDLSQRYMRNRYFPDKAIDIIDHAVGRAVLQGKKTITLEDIKEQVGSLTGLPIGKLEGELRNKLQGLTAYLKSRILGQDHIIDLVVDIIWPKTLGADLHPQRPNGVFLFAGPTGVGKTEFAKALSEFMFGSQKKLIRIDMSEFSEPHAVAKLLGAPFGYHGVEEGSPILNEIDEKPFSILLLDEIEKAHREIHKLFLQVFDSGVLTDTFRRHTYFSDVIIIMTSNISIERDHSIGFLSDETDQGVRDQLMKYFPAEFINRIDYIGVFNSISGETAEKIVSRSIIPQVKQKWQKKGIGLIFSNEAITLITQKGFSKKWGARNLERTVDELINTPLAKFMPEMNNNEIIKMEIGVKEGSLVFNEIK
jgi:ATP-dependent Clp protease ATP-binding subunit ClpC